MTEKQRMEEGFLFLSTDTAILTEYKKAKILVGEFNSTNENESARRCRILKELFKKIGSECQIEPPFHCDYGCNTSIGDNFHAGYDCLIIDVSPVTIGNNVFLGPRVGIYTAAYPIDADVRNKGYAYGKPVSIGNNVWIGANSVINPGVTIGDNVVIGSGTIVTKNIPDNVVVAGNPCRILRPITDEDRSYWQDQLNNK